MKAFTKIQIEAKSLKAELKAAGVKVLRCKQEKAGVSIVISDVEGNDELFKTFCKASGLRSTPNEDLKYSIASIKADFIQYGAIYNFKEII